MITAFVYAHAGDTPPAAQLLTVDLDGRPLHFLPTFMACERYPSEPRWRPAAGGQREHRHDVYHLVLYLEGSARFCWRGEWREANRGTLVITSPGESHAFGRNSAHSCAYAHISFRLSGTGGALSFAQYLGLLLGTREIRGQLPVCLNAREVRRMEDAYERVFSELAASGAVDWAHAQRRLLDLFMLVGQTVYDVGRNCGEADPLEVARREIERRYAQSLTVRELADVARLSPGHFLRAFRRRYGESPIHYQKVRRVQAARTLLLTTTLLCKEIAVRTGFGDEYQFNRAFRQICRMPPGEYRRCEQL